MYLSTSTHHSNQGYYAGNKKSIFLAGPTTRNSKNGTQWRWSVRKYLNDREDLVLFIPEPTDLSTGTPDSDIIPWWPKFEIQIDWELHHLSLADIILFWIPREFPDHPALTTNVEFGVWYKDPKVHYGRPDTSEKNRYLDYIWKVHTTKPIFNNLEELCKNVLTSLL